MFLQRHNNSFSVHFKMVNHSFHRNFHVCSTRWIKFITCVFIGPSGINSSLMNYAKIVSFLLFLLNDQNNPSISNRNEKSNSEYISYVWVFLSPMVNKALNITPLKPQSTAFQVLQYLCLLNLSFPNTVTFLSISSISSLNVH
jgi:hypothetical protein